MTHPFSRGGRVRRNHRIHAKSEQAVGNRFDLLRLKIRRYLDRNGNDLTVRLGQLGTLCHQALYQGLKV